MLAMLSSKPCKIYCSFCFYCMSENFFEELDWMSDASEPAEYIMRRGLLIFKMNGSIFCSVNELEKKKLSYGIWLSLYAVHFCICISVKHDIQQFVLIVYSQVTTMHNIVLWFCWNVFGSPYVFNHLIKQSWPVFPLLGSITHTMTRNVGPYTNLLRHWTRWAWT
jgi:hypothetical protein